jgi:hypothetical protein
MSAVLREQRRLAKQKKRDRAEEHFKTTISDFLKDGKRVKEVIEQLGYEDCVVLCSFQVDMDENYGGKRYVIRQEDNEDLVGCVIKTSIRQESVGCCGCVYVDYADIKICYPKESWRCAVM